MKIRQALIDLAIWSEGGLSYTELKEMPVDELLDVMKACRELNQRREAEIRKMRAKK